MAINCDIHGRQRTVPLPCWISYDHPRYEELADSQPLVVDECELCHQKEQALIEQAEQDLVDMQRRLREEL